MNCPIELGEFSGSLNFKSCFGKLINNFISYKPENKSCGCDSLIESMYSPESIKNYFFYFHSIPREKIIVNGPFEKRIALIDINKKYILISFNSPINKNDFFLKNQQDIKVESPSRHISYIHINQKVLDNTVRPKIKLAALYHPENFPLPRFALGISDIARSIREEYLGQVSLSDMQLGKLAEDLISEIAEEKPDIIGISITFGQYDVLEKIISDIKKINNYTPLVVIGGSLAALNAKRILEENPNFIVGLGPGEPSFKDIVRYWIGGLALFDINNIMFMDSNKQSIVTLKKKDENLTAGIPELDLLPLTLENKGVMQLEATRGCSYACSFCPRAHKGVWSEQSFDLLEKILPEINRIFDRHKDISKKIFLVDEEFFGYKTDDETTERILGVCNTLKKYQFSFETSARVDQVYRRNRDKNWHVERINLWKYLHNNGLDRVLFGVESGVESILERFNKKTKKFQNEYAIRILSAMQIPRRLTYITFDPLMSMEELIESYHFQGRKDLLLKPCTHYSTEEFFELLHKEEFIKENSLNEPLYKEISYMLVSMECLIGSKYLEKVESLGLAEEYNYSMGRRNARYIDDRIGLISYNSQLWVDRNFSLDYTIKSIEKIAPPDLRYIIRNLRAIVKDFAYDLLTKFLLIANNNLNIISESSHVNKEQIDTYINSWDYNNIRNNQPLLQNVMDDHFALMVDVFAESFYKVSPFLRKFDRDKLERILAEWRSRKEWRLINTD